MDLLEEHAASPREVLNVDEKNERGYHSLHMAALVGEKKVMFFLIIASISPSIWDRILYDIVMGCPTHKFDLSPLFPPESYYILIRCSSYFWHLNQILRIVLT